MVPAMNLSVAPMRSHEAHEAQNVHKAPETRKLRIMLVEDSVALTEYLRELIAQLPDMELVGVADTQAAALTMLVDLVPEVLILDLHLRTGNGFGVMRGLANIVPPPKVIVLTSFVLPEYRRRALTLGVNVFLDKSCDYRLLTAILNDWAHRTDPPHSA
jgi:DNA-binding NarL/FixJ family response regulator